MVAVFIQTPTPLALGAQALQVFTVLGSLGLGLAACAAFAWTKPAVRRVLAIAIVALVLSAGVVLADTVVSCGWCDPWWCQFGFCFPAP